MKNIKPRFPKHPTQSTETALMKQSSSNETFNMGNPETTVGHRILNVLQYYPVLEDDWKILESCLLYTWTYTKVCGTFFVNRKLLLIVSPSLKCFRSERPI